MFKRMAFFLVAVLMVTGCAGTASAFSDKPQVVEGSGMVVTAQRASGEFHAVRLNGEGNVIVTRGSSSGVTIEADDNFLALIETSVDNGVLIIDLDETRCPIDLRETQPIRFYVSTPRLDGIEINGQGSVTAHDLEETQLSLTINGSGQVNLNGTARVLNIGIHGAGHIAANDLRTTRTRVEIEGTGAVNVWTTGQLDTSIAGTGHIQYYGEPTVNQTITGLGTVTAQGEK